MLPLTCTVERLDGKAFLRVSGEIDLTNVALFSHHLRDLVELGARPVIGKSRI
jgi:hypothetical protein